ncbi:hypothetical protein P261_00589 [Lachnospiraceae bacterium TWA4]|nr:hypothetical protein P261_00589 [Lachnospiraceae bacterium TWA4]
MNKEELILMNRFSDLSRRADDQNRPIHTDFLNLYEQTIFSTFLAKNPSIQYKIEGGYEMAERKIVCFLPMWAKEYDVREFIQCVKIEFLAPKFAKTCTHRDYLGSIMSLGLDRQKFGDLLVDNDNGTAYLIGLPTAIQYVKESLTSVKHDSVKVTDANLEEVTAILKFEKITGTVSSLRLDSIIGLAFRVSRSKACDAIRAEKVFVNGKMVSQVDYKVKVGDILSFRGAGKAIFKEYHSKTKKDREAISIWRYQ